MRLETGMRYQKLLHVCYKLPKHESKTVSLIKNFTIHKCFSESGMMSVLRENPLDEIGLGIQTLTVFILPQQRLFHS